ncbi:MAG: DUF4382 domain-containing protein [Longimicrobiales bacterium]
MSVGKILGRGAIAFMIGLLSAASAGCEDSTMPEDNSHIRVLLTDAPSDFISKAEVWVSRVNLTPGEDGGDPLDLFAASAESRMYDLMQLRNGVTADLTGAVVVEPGMYHQLRLVVDSAFVTLADGYTFSDGTNSRSLKVPSGAQSGIKVQLSDAIDADAGDNTTVVVDFDVDRNFVIQGNPGMPSGMQGILFTPVLHEKSRSRSGES